MPCADSSMALLVLYGIQLYTTQRIATSTINFKTQVATQDTWVCYKFRETSHFKTAWSLLFPCWQAACLWQTWVWELFHTLTYLGKIQVKRQKVLKQHRIGNLKILTGKEAYRTVIWSYCFLWTIVVSLDPDTLIWCLLSPSEARWLRTTVRLFLQWRCCLWLELHL